MISRCISTQAWRSIHLCTVRRSINDLGSSALDLLVQCVCIVVVHAVVCRLSVGRNTQSAVLMQKGELTNQPWLECLINQNVVAIQLETMFVLSDNLLHCQQGSGHHQLQTNSGI